MGREKRMIMMCSNASVMLIAAILLSATVATVQVDPAIIPPDKAALEKWFTDNVKPFADREATLDPALVATEEGEPRLIKVGETGEFKKISDAIAAVPALNTKRVIIFIAPGVYNEKVTIPRDKPFVTLMGDAKNMPNITFNDDSKKVGTLYSASLEAESEYFMGVHLNVILRKFLSNSSPRPDGKGQQAVALKLGAPKAALYNVNMFGFQDTFCDDQGVHFIKDSYVEGTVDFIFGIGKSIYLNTHINVLGDKLPTVITANARENEQEDKGYAFVHCRVTGTHTVANTHLGRAWRAAPIVIFAYTEMGPVVAPEGWTDNNKPEYDSSVKFVEYKNTGPGADMSKRAPFAKELSEADANHYLSVAFIEGAKWLLPPPVPKL